MKRITKLASVVALTVVLAASLMAAEEKIRLRKMTVKQLQIRVQRLQKLPVKTHLLMRFPETRQKRLM